MIRVTSIVVAAAVGISVLAAAAMQSGQQQDRQDRERQAETFEGRIVDLHHYLTLEGSPDLSDPGIAGENFGGPIGLLVEEDRMIRGTRTVLHVLLVEPEREATGRSRDRIPDHGGPHHPEFEDKGRGKAGIAKYKQAQEKTGEQVRITGKMVERDNVKAIVIRNIQPQRETGRSSEERERQDQGRPGR